MANNMILRLLFAAVFVALINVSLWPVLESQQEKPPSAGRATYLGRERGPALRTRANKLSQGEGVERRSGAGC